MKIITLGKISLFNLFLLFIPLGTTSGTMLLKISPVYGSHTIFYVVLVFLGQIFIGIAELVKIYRNEKQTITSQILTSHPMERIRPKQNHFIIYSIITGITVLDVVRALGLYILMNFESIKVLLYELKTSELIWMGILSTFFLHYPFCRHHLFSVILIVIGMILASLNFVDFNKDKNLIYTIIGG